jgi:cobyrinic acid a,c-diamide synthase
MLHIPRVIIAGLSGGAGKTLVSLGLARALARQGRAVRAFKKGPDYIDATWLSLAARAPQGNLDPFFLPGPLLHDHFVRMAAGYDLALVEGNRGLFDGLDIDGSCSTAEVSRILQAPLILVLDCTRMTRTVAALVKGCMTFEPGLNIGGVILNRTGNSRHRAMLQRAVEELCGVPVLGVLPRKTEGLIAERHMGLVGPAGLTGPAGVAECAQANTLLDGVADFITEHVDLAAVRGLAESAPDLPEPSSVAPTEQATLSDTRFQKKIDAGMGTTLAVSARRPIIIKYVRDAAFWFYYQENLEALQAAGAVLEPVSLLDDAPWPEIDGLYIGGGLPELHAETLSANTAKRALVASLARAGLPIYAECGGFMYLADHLIVSDKKLPMAGVFSCAVEFCRKPQGLGYVMAETLEENPFHPIGASFPGHEFHFSRVIPDTLNTQTHIFRLTRGRGMTAAADGTGRDGLLHNNTFASYTHIYAPALPHWAPSFVALCRKTKQESASA